MGSRLGRSKLQQLPSDNSIQKEDRSEVLDDLERISPFSSIVGSGIYLCQERYDVAFTVQELASRIANPTIMALHHLKKLLRFLKKAIDCCLLVEFLQGGEGYVKKGESYWRLETFSGSDWEARATESQHQEGSKH